MNELTAMIERGSHREAARWLVERHGREVLGMCRAMLRDQSAAEDATQDVFSRAFVGMRSYRGQAQPRSWLLTIAKNRCIDELRRKQLQPWQLANDDEIDQAPATNAHDVAQCLTDRETVAAALSALESDERALVVLRYRHGMSFAELASAFGLREGTARMRVSRALKRMRDAVAVGEAPTIFPLGEVNLHAGSAEAVAAQAGAPPSLFGGSERARASAASAPPRRSFWDRLLGRPGKPPTLADSDEPPAMQTPSTPQPPPAPPPPAMAPAARAPVPPPAPGAPPQAPGARPLTASGAAVPQPAVALDQKLASADPPLSASLAGRLQALIAAVG